MDTLAKLVTALGDIDEELFEEGIEEEIEEVLQNEQALMDLQHREWESKRRKTDEDPLSRMLLLLDPKFKEYLDESRHKVPHDAGKTVAAKG